MSGISKTPLSLYKPKRNLSRVWNNNQTNSPFLHQPKSNSFSTLPAPITANKPTFKYQNSQIICTPKRLRKSFSKIKLSVAQLRQKSEFTLQSLKIAADLQKELQKNLKLIQPNEKVREFQIYQQIFSSLIAKNKYFGKILGLIQQNYEWQMQNPEVVALFKNNLELQRQIKLLGRQKVKQQKQKIQKLQQFQQLNQKGVEMSRKLRKRQDDIQKIHNKFQEKTRKASQSFPEDLQAWKYLILKHQNYSELENQLQTQQSKYKKSKVKMNMLIKALKARGYSVNGDQDSEVENTDYEALIDWELPVVKKPDLIPVLDMQEIENYTPFASSSESEQEDSDKTSY